MGRRTERSTKSHTLPSSPSHSFSSSSSASSSDFEFTISVSPCKSTNLCPADDLFYKGQLLPLHLSPRLSMVRTLLLASSSTSSSSDTTTTASRDSSGSSNDSHSSFNGDLVLVADCDSSRPSSVTEDEEFNRLHNPILQSSQIHLNHGQIKKSKYFSLSRFSSVFRKETKNRDDQDNVSASSVKRMSATAKEVINKYLKKVKPLYEKLSQKQQLQQQQQETGGVTSTRLAATVSFSEKAEGSTKHTEISCKGTSKENGRGFSHSFSGNLRYPRRRSSASSCPSSMRSSPSHSGVLSRTGRYMGTGKGGGMNQSDMSSTEELQNAIQGAIAHCKNSMIQNKSTVLISNEI